ncbi:lyase family protein [Corynebacterium confusum]|uniref:lyase family protein n=1 Tax=Corynebacterium confusum TaxID=71254 RepID=UPI0025B2950B|nr:lyase family protein [Corynebacterium confusum]WJY89258.1 3-carboxy-cis,cis-muconate cycloisomerase [Corynebacterium confusum]
MPFSSFDSAISSRGYVTPEMEKVWSVRETIAGWYAVEASLAAAQGQVGMIPESAAAAIVDNATVSSEVEEAISRGAMGNPFTLGLDALRAELPEDARGWVHFGATTQDILDTGRALQIKASLDLIMRTLRRLIDVLVDLAHEHADTVMVARTNGQYALPTTLGYRVATWVKALRRCYGRLQITRDHVLLVQFSGAVGTYAAMGEYGSTVARLVARRLGLEFEEIAWHAQRDTITELACTVSIYGQTLAKIAEDLFEMQRSDAGEAEEELDPHFSGSSTMPQKRNPFTTMKISAAARMAAGAASTMLTQTPSADERDHRAIEVERDCLPRIFAAVEGAGRKLEKLLGNLSFDADALRANVEAEGVLTMTEAIMMEFAKVIGHGPAHDLVQDFATQYRDTGISLENFVAGRPEVADQLKFVDLTEIQRPENYTGLASEIARAI